MRFTSLFLLLFLLISCRPDYNNFSREEFKATFLDKLQKERDTLAAFEILNKNIEKFPDDASAKMTLIQLQVITGKLSEDEGLRLLNEIELYRSIVHERDHLALYSVYDSIPPDSVIKKLNALITKYPNVANNYRLIGKKLLEVERFHEAIESFDKCISMDSSWHSAIADKAFAQYMLGDKEVACKTWQTLLTDGQAYHDKYCK